jgi:hypothetical protein
VVSTLTADLETLVGLALADLGPLWTLTATELADALSDVVPATVDVWTLAASALAADWYDGQRVSADVVGRFEAVTPDVNGFGGEALAGWGTELLKGAEPDIAGARFRVEGGLQKRIVNSANLTVTDSTARDPAARGYQRSARAGACDFCRMVASRGAVFTKASSTFACHEHCFCAAVPAWGGRELPVSPYRASDRPSTPEDRARVRKWIADNHF